MATSTAYHSSDPLIISNNVSPPPAPTGAINSNWLLGNEDDGNAQDNVKINHTVSSQSFEPYGGDDAQERILPPPPCETRYRFRTYIPRALLNSLGPLVVLAAYALTVYYYLVNSSLSGIIPPHPIDSRIVFYAWVVLSIFVLGWAKSGMVGFEAAALGRPSLAPANAARLMWHSDSAWAEINGWYKALVAACLYGKGKVSGRRNVEWDGPGLIWFYFAFSSLLLTIAIPLVGLSMESSTALRLSDRPVIIVGPNETTFNARVSDDIVDEANARWRLGNPTTPEGDAIFYAPEGTSDVSNTYFEDAIQDNYQKGLQNLSSALNQTIGFFAGPAVSERVYGRAWGLLNHVACVPLDPYVYTPGHEGGLRLLNITGVGNWTYGNSTNSTNYKNGNTGTLFGGGTKMQGVQYRYLMASDVDYVSDNYYANASEFPLGGRVELVIWQTYDPETASIPDDSFKQMVAHPLVQASTDTSENLVYLGYAVSCSAQTSVGYATISATTNTYSDFQPQDAENHFALTSLLTRYPGVRRIQSLVYAAFTSVTHSMELSPRCNAQSFPACDGWFGANSATRGAPMVVPDEKSRGPGLTFVPLRNQSPTITPEQMVLAMQKLFGEVAAAAMSSGPGNWTLTNTSEPQRFLRGLDTIPTIIPGVIPYKAPLVLLAIWVVITTFPQLIPSFFLGRRWGAALDGITLFRLGAEWTGHVHRLYTGELLHLGESSLREVPGMIGDMNATGTDYSGGGGLGYKGAGGEVEVGEDEAGLGFIGLSTSRASVAKGRNYTMRRSRVMDEMS